MNSASVQGSEGLIRIRFSLAKTGAVDRRCPRAPRRPLEPGDVDQVGQADVGDEVEVVGDDRHLAAPLEDDVAVGVHVGDLGVRRVVVADRRHVAARAVGVVGDHGDVCWVVRRVVEHAGAGRGSPGFTAAGAARVVLGPLGDPVAEVLVVLEPRIRRRPPSCGSSPRGLRRIMLASGSTGSMRRPAASRLRTVKSWSGR